MPRRDKNGNIVGLNYPDLELVPDFISTGNTSRATSKRGRPKKTDEPKAAAETTPREETAKKPATKKPDPVQSESANREAPKTDDNGNKVFPTGIEFTYMDRQDKEYLKQYLSQASAKEERE